MKFTADREMFSRAVSHAQSVTSVRGEMPQLGNILVRAEGNSVFCVATDLRLTVVAEVDADVEEQGSVAVLGKNFHGIVKAIAGDTVSVEKLPNGWTQVLAGKSKYKVAGLPDADFPQIAEPDDVEFFEVPSGPFVELIRKTIFSVSSDETRTMLNGVHLESDGERVRMVSTDGHRLSLADAAWNMPRVKSIIIPFRALKEIKRLVEKSDTFDMGIDDNKAFVRARDVVLGVSLIDAMFPPYDRIVPNEHDVSFVPNRRLLSQALHRMTEISTAQVFHVTLHIAPGKLLIEGDDPDSGHGVEELEIDYDGPELDIVLNPRYLTDVLDEMDGDDVQIEAQKALDPFVLKTLDGDYVGVVMPARL